MLRQIITGGWGGGGGGVLDTCLGIAFSLGV